MTMQTERPRRRNVTCPSCGSIFQITFHGEVTEYDKTKTCYACDAIANDATVKGRIASRGECALCGRPIVLEDGVPTHLERERDEWHRPMYVTEGM